MSRSITIKIIAEDEFESPESNRDFAPGFAQAVREVQKKAQGKWGWCSVKVEASVKVGGDTLIGTAHLGGCSYLSAEDFAAGGYLPQMIEEAIDEVAKKQEKLGHAIRMKEEVKAS